MCRSISSSPNYFGECSTFGLREVLLLLFTLDVRAFSVALKEIEMTTNFGGFLFKVKIFIQHISIRVTIALNRHCAADRGAGFVRWTAQNYIERKRIRKDESIVDPPCYKGVSVKDTIEPLLALRSARISIFKRSILFTNSLDVTSAHSYWYIIA